MIYSGLVLILFVAFLGQVQCFGNTGSIRSKKTVDISMKIFDWKKRAAFKKYEVPDDYVLSVNTIFPIPGSRRKLHRVGRGISAGQGKKCGFGQHGQNSRAGSGTRPGFEGGQTPLYRRLPKYVGKPMRGHVKTEYALIKLDKLNAADEGSTVDFKMLLEKGVVTKPNKGRDIFKVVGGNGELAVKGLQVRAHAFTASARQAIESLGGSCIVLSPTRHIPIEEAQADARARDAANLVALRARRKMKAQRDAARVDAL